jgi:methylation protein EvaC
VTRTECGGCGAGGLELILDLGTSPLADAFPTDPTQVETRYPLQLLVCQRCWLVQLGEVVPDEALWSDYGFYSSTSPALTAYHAGLAELLLQRHGARASHLTVEIACNDGSLLDRLAPWVRAVGVDPAAGPAEVARGRGLDVRTALFDQRVADELRDELGPAGLVIASNVAAHVADLPGFLGAIRSLLADDGVAVLEVQSLADLLLGNQFDHVYHEHRFYFSVASLSAAVWAAGMSVVAMDRTPMQGGSIRLTCRRAASPTGRMMVGQPGEFGYVNTGMDVFAAVQARAEYLRTSLLGLVGAELDAGRKLAGFAASAKSTTLLNWCGLGPDQVSHIVDTTPHKIGRFTPGTHIPIVAEGARPDPDTYLLLAWNYLGRALRGPFEGRWLVPIPVPVLL